MFNDTMKEPFRLNPGYSSESKANQDNNYIRDQENHRRSEHEENVRMEATIEQEQEAKNYQSLTSTVYRFRNEDSAKD